MWDFMTKNKSGLDPFFSINIFTLSCWHCSNLFISKVLSISLDAPYTDFTFILFIIFMFSPLFGMCNFFLVVFIHMNLGIIINMYVPIASCKRILFVWIFANEFWWSNYLLCLKLYICWVRFSVSYSPFLCCIVAIQFWKYPCGYFLFIFIQAKIWEQG